ncbi:LOW QUALITY PROTEIN: SET domain-containing protein SmydA-8 [Procambarus clarkii]|uniref:LOW QUALITY PROTEIN: SET domain-containing protein SmydA-8 n=1 Tax=Procambarus clarkii TaxID=6728 RepID=UPI00374394EE
MGIGSGEGSGGDSGGCGSCDVCQTAASMACGGCGSAHYCCKDHQRQHWPQHRDQCPPYKLISSPEAGKYLVASRPLPAGQVLVEEVPLAVGPLSISALVCLGCHGSIRGNNFPRCPGCWWPLCSLECASSSRHQDECPILATDTKRIATPVGQQETPRYDVILTLRCLLLKTKDPKAWQIMTTMANHSEQRQLNCEDQQIVTVRYMTEVLKLDHDQETLHQVRGAIATNGMEIRSDKNARVRAMYPVVRLFNNSCIPNVHLSCGPGGRMQARTTVPVQIGEPLCISYTGALMPLWERRETLTLTYHFSCNCPRCEDPTELGTFFSSPKCTQCKGQCEKSYLISSTWLGDTVWRCPACKMERPDADVQEDIKDWLQRIEMDDIFTGNFRRAVAAMQEVEDQFHNQHYIWMRAAHSALYQLSDNNTEQALKMKIKMWKKLMFLYSVLEPGLTKRRGMTLLELGIIMLRAAKLEYESGDAFMPEFLKQLREIVKYLEESTKILNLEPEGTRGPELAKRAHEKKAEAVEFLQRLDSATIRAE